MKRVLAGVLGASAIAFSGAASADWSFNGGVESFDWKESTSPSVKESGLRWTVGLSWRQSKEPGLSLGYDLKIYNGNVDYDGAALFGAPVPISDETHYRGAVNELQAIYRMPNGFAVVFAAGYDFWKRELNGPPQREDWKVIYGKLGGSYGETMKQGFLGSAGVKYPVWTRENGNFNYLGAIDNPRLRPGKDISLYATAGWRFNQNWDVVAYYDSYRFKESNVVAVQFPGGIGGFLQPESKMDVYGLKVQYNIQ